MKFIIITFIGIGLYLAFRILNFIKKKVYKKTLLHRITSVLPILELTSWIAFIFWSTSFTLSNKSYYSILVVVLVVVLVILLSWFLARDFIAGVLLKSQQIYKSGQLIKTEKYSGRITKMGNLHMSLQTENGESARIPYASLSNTVIVKQKQDYADTSSFTLSVPLSLSKDEWVKKIEKDILSCPWVSTKANPIIRIVDETKDHFVFSIRVVTLSVDHALQLETMLKKSIY